METPRFEYSRSQLKQSAKFAASLSAPFGLTVRYAIKANPFPEIIDIFDKAGLHFDASSSYEAQHLLDLGITGKKISLSSQQSAHNLAALVDAGVIFIATSLNQLETFATLQNRPKEVGIRINPGVGSGANNRLTTGGPNASFGIWHEYLSDVVSLAKKHELKVNHVQIHIGTGTDPAVWSQVAADSLELLHQLPDVTHLNLGGGFKSAYRPGEHDADVEAIIDAISDKVADFQSDHGRKIKLEIEPGRFLVVHAGTLIAQVDDIVDTGEAGHTFIRLNTGMNDILRPSMYGAYHEIEVLNDATEKHDYIVVGHNCETGDTLTVAQGDPEEFETRNLNRASIGDLVAIREAGAYCASMRARGYNSYPDAQEYMVD